jgi:hypothetical protein
VIAEHCAVFASLIETCKMNDIDPLAKQYVDDVGLREVTCQVAPLTCGNLPWE